MNATITKGERGKLALPLSHTQTHLGVLIAFVVCVPASLLLLFSIPFLFLFTLPGSPHFYSFFLSNQRQLKMFDHKHTHTHSQAPKG